MADSLDQRRGFGCRRAVGMQWSRQRQAPAADRPQVQITLLDVAAPTRRRILMYWLPCDVVTPSTSHRRSGADFAVVLNMRGACNAQGLPVRAARGDAGGLSGGVRPRRRLH